MYEKNNDFPSKSDMELLLKLDNKGKELIEDLNKIFSYRRPKAYKLYVEKLDYIPTDEEKVIRDLIKIIKKYNEVLANNMAIRKMKEEENKYSSLILKGMKYINRDIYAKEAISINNLYGNLINKYKNKHFFFDKQFLSRNIFNRSGLLPYTKKETINFFDSEIHNYGQNCEKSIKTINYIEKLYELIEKISHRLTFGRQKKGMNIQTQRSLGKDKKTEILDKINKFKLQRKEIKNDIKEIKQIKELIKSVNNHYNEIFEEIRSNNSRNKKKLVKIHDKKRINLNMDNNENIKNKDNFIDNNNNDKSERTIKIIDSKNNYPNINSNNNYERKKNTFYKIKIVKSSDNYNKTASVDKFSGLNLNNNRNTSTTGFIDLNTNLSNNNTCYNSNKIILKNLNSRNTFNDISTKIISPSTTKSIPKNNSIISFSNDMNKTSKNKIIFQWNNNNTITSNNNGNVQPLLRTNSLFSQNLLSPNMSSPTIFSINNEKKPIAIPKLNIKKKKPSIKKRKTKTLEKSKSKLELYYMRRRKIPKIYEELLKYKNILNVIKKSRNNTQKAKIEKLFSELYDIKTIRSLNEKKAPKELYNSYYHMKDSIENCHGPDKIYRKYQNVLGDSIRKKIGKSLQQDDELKNKYYDFMQMIIKKRIEDEDEES